MIDLHEKLHVMVEQVAERVANSFPSYIDVDDVAQAIWVRVYEESNSLTRLIGEGESWERKLYPTMTKWGNAFALGEDAAVNGYSLDDVYEYSTDTVKRLLEVAFSYEDWQSFSTVGDGQPRSRKLANTHGDMQAMLADVKSAVEKLPERQYNALVWTYKYNKSSIKLAEELEITQQGASALVGRAIQAVRKQLGRKDFSEMRGDSEAHSRTYGSAAASARVERDYEG